MNAAIELISHLLVRKPMRPSETIVVPLYVWDLGELLPFDEALFSGSK
jgi:hypothetical protein